MELTRTTIETMHKAKATRMLTTDQVMANQPGGMHQMDQTKTNTQGERPMDLTRVAVEVAGERPMDLTRTAVNTMHTTKTMLEGLEGKR
jgi:hypothetical protein